MIWNEKQADILKGHDCSMTECSTPQESSQSIFCENRLVGLFLIRAYMTKISQLFGALLISRLFFKYCQMSKDFSDK